MEYSTSCTSILTPNKPSGIYVSECVLKFVELTGADWLIKDLSKWMRKNSCDYALKILLDANSDGTCDMKIYDFNSGKELFTRTHKNTEVPSQGWYFIMDGTLRYEGEVDNVW